MIGHFLLSLSEPQEDRVLTRAMRQGCYWISGERGPCLVGTVFQFPQVDAVKKQRPEPAGFLTSWQGGDVDCIEERYDRLCARFGAPRVNNAIRNRILSNRARRTLQNRPASEPVLLGVVR